MRNEQVAWALGIALVPLGLWLLYRFVFWLWRALPDGRVKRLLFRSYLGDDHGPWAKEPWQRKKARERSALIRRDGEGL